MAKLTIDKPHFVKCPVEVWWILKRIAAERKETLRDTFIEVVTTYDQRTRKNRTSKQT